MTLAGVIGLSLVGAFVVGTIVLAVVRILFVNWCPACLGRGYESDGNRAWPCTACGGSGVLHVPDAVPAGWTVDDKRWPRRAPNG